MKYYCNPLNLTYYHQFFRLFGKKSVFREMADPSIVHFQGKYYMFASMACGFFVSGDLVSWEHHPFPGDIPLYDYAPDACVVGEYLYFSASKDPGILTPVYRTKDPLTEPFEKVSESVSAWDPNLFRDADGKLYYYWGCSREVPVKGVVLNSEDLTPLTDPRELFLNQKSRCGYERIGEDHNEKTTNLIEKMLGLDPAIEGPWMNWHNGRYYLQYAVPGTQYNIYADGVYEADAPLGEFRLAKNNPFSYKPGGFITGAGHGSTFTDAYGNLWHASSQRISVNHMFERRIGLWPAGFDSDGELFCNQRFGDWIMPMPEEKIDPWKEPEWMLLSVGKPVRASSWEKAHMPACAAEENIQTFWQAGTKTPGQWVEVDLGKPMQLHGAQINFADGKLPFTAYERKRLQGSNPFMRRFIDQRQYKTRWRLEISTNGEHYTVWKDKSQADTDLVHDLVVSQEGITARYVRLTVLERPFGQKAAVSGLRVFGHCDGPKPKAVENVIAVRTGSREMTVRFDGQEIGYNILWGHTPEKLYHCYTVYGKNEQQIRALVADQDYYVRVDSFNEAGTTHGAVTAVPKLI